MRIFLFDWVIDDNDDISNVISDVWEIVKYT